MYEVVGTIVAVCVLLCIAFSDRIPVLVAAKRKRVKASYWGLYSGSEPRVDESGKPVEEETLETPDPGRKQRIVVGSTMYAMGRGVSFRR